jgi:hypothetical protein
MRRSSLADRRRCCFCVRTLAPPLRAAGELASEGEQPSRTKTLTLASNGRTTAQLPVARCRSRLFRQHLFAAAASARKFESRPNLAEISGAVLRERYPTGAKPVSDHAVRRPGSESLSPRAHVLRHAPRDPIGVVRRQAMSVESSRVERSRRVATEVRHGQRAGR